MDLIKIRDLKDIFATLSAQYISLDYYSDASDLERIINRLKETFIFYANDMNLHEYFFTEFVSAILNSIDLQDRLSNIVSKKYKLFFISKIKTSLLEIRDLDNSVIEELTRIQSNLQKDRIV